MGNCITNIVSCQVAIFIGLVTFNMSFTDKNDNCITYLFLKKWHLIKKNAFGITC